MKKYKELSFAELISTNGGTDSPLNHPLKYKWYTLEGWIEVNYRIGLISGGMIDRLSQVKELLTF